MALEPGTILLLAYNCSYLLVGIHIIFYQIDEIDNVSFMRSTS